MIRFFTLAVVAFLTFFAFSAQAADPWVAKAEAYLQQLKTAKADFQIIAPDGTLRQGVFYLKRPGRLRFEYATAPYDLIVADGTLINMYDATAKQAQSAPIQATLANFFLRKKMSLSGDLKTTHVEEDASYVHITLVQAKDADSGNLILSFSKSPFALRGWRVSEYTGNVTRVRLRNLKENLALSPDLFVYKDQSGKNNLNQ